MIYVAMWWESLAEVDHHVTLISLPRGLASFEDYMFRSSQEGEMQILYLEGDHFIRNHAARHRGILKGHHL